MVVSDTYSIEPAENKISPFYGAWLGHAEVMSRDGQRTGNVGSGQLRCRAPGGERSDLKALSVCQVSTLQYFQSISRIFPARKREVGTDVLVLLVPVPQTKQMSHGNMQRTSPGPSRPPKA